MLQLLRKRSPAKKVKDKEDLVHKATGWMLRFAGAKDCQRLVKFLDEYAAIMPRTMLHYSIEHFDKEVSSKKTAVDNYLDACS